MNVNHVAVINALQSGRNSSREIANYTGLPIEQVHARLHELKEVGVVHAYKLRPDGRCGRMPKFYRIAA